MTIIAILFLLIGNWFQSPNKQIIHAHKCLDDIHRQAQSRINAWLTQKAIQNPESIFPQTYSITFDTNNQHILLHYDQETYHQIHLWENTALSCNSDKYTIYMSWDTQQIDTNQQGMSANTFDNYIQFTLCENWLCIGLGTIYYDTRTRQIQLYICPQWPDTFCFSQEDESTLIL